MLTRLGSRVAQEINFNHQKLKDGMVFRFLTFTTMFSVIMTNIYQFFSDSDRVPLRMFLLINDNKEHLVNKGIFSLQGGR